MAGNGYNGGGGSPLVGAAAGNANIINTNYNNTAILNERREDEQLISRRGLQDLMEQVDGHETLDPQVQGALHLSTLPLLSNDDLHSRH